MVDLKNFVVRGERAKKKEPTQGVGFQVRKSEVAKIREKYPDINLAGTCKNMLLSLIED